MKFKLLIIIGIISTSIWSYLILIGYIEERTNSIVDSKLDKVDKQLIVRLRKNEITQQSLLIELEESLLKIKKNQKIIKNIANLSKDRLNNIHVETGILKLSNNKQPYLSSPNGCEANRGLVKEKILFNRLYTVPPEILTSFHLLDFADGTDHRLKLEVSDITNSSFNVTYTTWCDTRISQSKAKWLAIGI
jgi:hypothetical protein